VNETAAPAISPEISDYKKTLNLPQTDFPMQANLSQREPQMLARWESEKLYAQVQKATAGRKPYWFVDGPPYANGDIHIGHAVNKVLKDMVVKAARLNGCDAPFVPGWDCHGLPIELQVEKKFGKVGEKLSAAEFRAKCREYANEQIERQRADFKRLGVLADWEKPYLTMQPAFEAEQLRVLARIVKNGHVVRGFKPVHWCADCGSSLAEAEVEYQDKQSTAIYVAFAAADPKVVARQFGIDENAPDKISFVIWTTTPWSLPGNQAIAMNPEIDYALVDFGRHGHFVIAEALIDALAARLDVEAHRLGRAAAGTSFENLLAIHPFAPDRHPPIVLGSHVTLEAGTGLVHTAPAHGVDDFLVCREYGIEVNNPIGMDSRFKDGTPVVAGMHLKKAEAPILDALRANGSLVFAQNITHSYPHCWRHKTPLYTLATAQWFIAMDEMPNAAVGNAPESGELKSVRSRALAAIDNDVRFIPDWGQARMRGMVEGRPDWCISRQRFWGVPLALFIHKQTQTAHPQSAALLHRVADKVAAQGLEAWFGSSAADWLGDEAADYDKCTDTLDVWFDSGSAHQGMFVSTQPQALDAQGLAPLADIYLEGSDQHRGWFQSSLLTSVAMRGRAPYKSVLTHGFTVDEQGRKMSKSLGNVVAPQTVTKTLGADVLRLWVAASDYSGEIAISDNLLKRIADAYRRIRNTARYLLSNLHDFEPSRDAVALQELLEIDRWAIAQAARLQQRIQQFYADAEFHLVYQELHNFCVVDLGGLYLDILKDRLYTLPAKSVARRSAQTALLQIAEALVRWIAPMLSFTADEIWRLLPGDRSASLFVQTWHAFDQHLAIEKSGGDSGPWTRMTAVRDAVKKVLEDLRAREQIGSGLEAVVTIYADGETYQALAHTGAELRFWFITSEAIVLPLVQRMIDRDPATIEADVEAKLEDGAIIWIAAHASTAPKCARCWHRREDVGADAAHPLICARCASNVAGAGERRLFV
jgi:isoleucyl-tRNA synthetase